MLKGEADVLITDPHGIVQAILEIKTASESLPTYSRGAQQSLYF
jgi:hypothetical protein